MNLYSIRASIRRNPSVWIADSIALGGIACIAAGFYTADWWLPLLAVLWGGE